MKQITAQDLMRDSTMICRLGKSRIPLCACGKPAWRGICHKCARLAELQRRRNERKARQIRKELSL